MTERNKESIVILGYLWSALVAFGWILAAARGLPTGKLVPALHIAGGILYSLIMGRIFKKRSNE